MKNFHNIQNKLQQFIKKYYTNELIKGLILFTSFGLLYFFITAFIEYFLWLPIAARSILFFLFIAVELALLIKFIIIPLAKLFGLKKGISLAEASAIIGRHFPEVDDKLLNLLQLNNNNNNQSELLIASIEQKSSNLQPIPFKKAINFKGNVKYLKYLSIPLVILLFTGLTGNNSIFNESFTRVVNYKTAYEPPAPFSYIILNDKLQCIEGQSYELVATTVGNIVPDNVTIHFNGQSYILKEENGKFIYQFNNLKETFQFYLEANNVYSNPYKLEILKTPNVTGFEMFISYPKYTGKQDELIKNTGNAIVPEGAVITWNITTKDTDSVKFITNTNKSFLVEAENKFSLSKQVRNNLNYRITTSNKQLIDYENIEYNIQVIKDEYPKIKIKSDIDSVSRGPVQFVGQLSDDYGINKLQLVYFKKDDDQSLHILDIDINTSSFEEFYYIFSPENLNIDRGEVYNMYFQVVDNDAINGGKISKSKIFSYYNKTKQEVTDELLKEQQTNLEELKIVNQKSEDLNKKLDEFSDKLRKKSDLDWNDKKEFNQFLERQEKYKQMQQKHTEKLKENLEEQEENNEDEYIQNRKDELKKRIEEAQELQEKNDLLEQLKKMSDKLRKEQMLDKLDKLTEQNKQEKKTLERLLELSKRFFVEKKAVQITNKLDSLVNRQNKEAEKLDSKATDQNKLNKAFDDIKKDFEELRKQNSNLAQPMNFPPTKNEEIEIEKQMKGAEDDLNNLENNSTQDSNANEEEQKSISKKQKSAARKQKELKDKMSGSLEQMEGEMLNENIEDLKQILKNLLLFSFDQEALLIDFGNIDSEHAEFPKKLRKQHILKENFEHIDDSLYTLSLRIPELTSKIQEDLTDAHYNLYKSLENIAENRIQSGRSNQQYTMTSANNLADMLSDLLNSLQNPSMGQGKGKGGQPQFSLPDIIKEQGKLKKQMQQGIKNESGKGEERMSGEQFRIYQEQNALKEALNDLLDKNGNKGSEGKQALKQMEELEKELLDKGFDKTVMQKMNLLEHQLLKLDDAILDQGKDDMRKSETNTKSFDVKSIPELKHRKLFFNKDEILNREPLPLKNVYRKRVQLYFKEI
ncbi:DUF4175 family protein [Aureibaculum marinum]|uniref:DUF4175 family protein n=1 Tax=Aureibaculum marinum TaxID=2487930 RepID=A0A3N4NY50_9FLAO|nr:DUF4175 family protein [Aureibaculum marinum]RPD96499.1 DUF4175 family protein [Aureibaculum marinum]